MKSVINRKSFLLFLIYVLICFFVINYFGIIEYIKFDSNAPDLPEGKGEEIKNELFSGDYSYGIIFRDFQALNEALIPIFLSIALILYSKRKDTYLKYSIGKEMSYSKLRRNSKFKILLGLCFMFSFVFFSYLIVSYLLTGLLPRDSANFNDTFINNFISNDYLILFIYFVESNIYILTSGYVLLSFADSSISPIKIAIIYIIIMFFVDGSLFTIIGTNFNISASTSFILFGYSSPFVLIFSYLYVLVAYLIQKRYIEKEV